MHRLILTTNYILGYLKKLINFMNLILKEMINVNINDVKDFVKKGDYHKYDYVAQESFFKGYKQAFREEKIQHRLKNNFLSKSTYKFLEGKTPEKFREYSYVREKMHVMILKKGTNLVKPMPKSTLNKVSNRKILAVRQLQLGFFYTHLMYFYTLANFFNASITIGSLIIFSRFSFFIFSFSSELNFSTSPVENNATAFFN